MSSWKSPPCAAPRGAVTDLDTVADGGDRLLVVNEGLGDLQYALVQADILGSAATGDEEAGVVLRGKRQGIDRGEAEGGYSPSSLQQKLPIDCAKFTTHKVLRS